MDRALRRISSIFIGLLFYFSSGAQSAMQLIVQDESGEPLAFVTVLPDNKPELGLLTDIEGRFQLPLPLKIRSLVLRYVGFKTAAIRLDSMAFVQGKPAIITMYQSGFDLPEAVILSGENPANALIRKAIAHRKRNNPENLDEFVCNTYNKISFALTPDRDKFEQWSLKRDTTKKGFRRVEADFAELEKATANNHFFLMESATEKRFKYPDLQFERILQNRVSGFKKASFTALANAVQPFSFYGDFLPILDKSYLNPISPGSPDKYFFHIEDTLYRSQDTVYIISFKPKKGKKFEALQGVLHLNTDGWALQNVRANAADEGNIQFSIEQQYTRVPRYSAERGRQWFPEQLNFEISIPKYPAAFAGTSVIGRSYIYDINLHPDLKKSDFTPESPLIIEPLHSLDADSLWQAIHLTNPLSTKEINTYTVIDSVGKKHGFEMIRRISDAIITARWPVVGEKLSLDLPRFFALNAYEKMRLGIGLTTASAFPLRRPHAIDVSAYTGYGIKDKAWKYGGSGIWRITQGQNRTFLKAEYRNDLLEPGALHEFPDNSLVSRSIYAGRMDTWEESSLTLGRQIAQGLYSQVVFRHQKLQPNYAYAFGAPTTDSLPIFHFDEMSLYLSYTFEQKKNTVLNDEVRKETRFPILELGMARAFKGLIDGDFGFTKWIASIHQAKRIRNLGRLSWRVEGGWVNAKVPYSKLFSLAQSSGGGITGIFYVGETFQTFGADTIWLSNRFVNTYFTLNVGNILYRTKWSRPELSVIQNMAYGTLQSPELQQYIKFRSPDEPIFESGLRMDNVIRMNYFNIAHIGFGGAVFLRWGKYAEQEWTKNFSWRLAIKATL